MTENNITKIFVSESGLLFFNGEEGDLLASREEYLLADRCPCSVFEALEPGETVLLQEGLFILSDELDLIRDCNCGSGEPWFNCSSNSAYCG